MAVALTGWYVGYVIAAAVIVVVVVLVSWILALARRIGVQAIAIVDEISEIRGTTAALPAVATVNEKLTAAVSHAVAARTALVGGR